MDKELALAVFQNFNEGLVVSESMLEKAAQTLNFSPAEILQEARLRSIVTDYLEKNASSEFLPHYLALACGVSLDRLEKIAKINDLPVELAAISFLQAQNFAPHEKLAAVDDGSSLGQNLQQNPALLQGALLSNDPFGNVMYQPSPTAAPQVPPDQNGNFQQLLDNYQNQDQIQGQQQQLGADQMLEQAGQEQMQGQQPGIQPSYSKEQIEQALSTADPMGKSKYIFPQGTPEQLQRLSEAVANVEQQVGIPITDPGQLKKLVAGLQKQEKSLLDEAIKTQFEAPGGDDVTGPLPGTGQSTEQPQKIASLLRLVRFKEFF